MNKSRDPATETPVEQTISDKQLAANQANARRSTGPTSAAGKAESSKNATKDNFYGEKSPMAPYEDPDDYAVFFDAFMAELAPADEEERALAQQVVESTWRLKRIFRVETRLYQELWEDPPRLVYELNKLSLIQMRLERSKHQAREALWEMQEARLESEGAADQDTARLKEQYQAMMQERRNPQSVGAPMRAAACGTEPPSTRHPTVGATPSPAPPPVKHWRGIPPLPVKIGNGISPSIQMGSFRAMGDPDMPTDAMGSPPAVASG